MKNRRLFSRRSPSRYVLFSSKGKASANKPAGFGAWQKTSAPINLGTGEAANKKKASAAADQKASAAADQKASAAADQKAGAAADQKAGAAAGRKAGAAAGRKADAAAGRKAGAAAGRKAGAAADQKAGAAAGQYKILDFATLSSWYAEQNALKEVVNEPSIQYKYAAEKQKNLRFMLL